MAHPGDSHSERESRTADRRRNGGSPAASITDERSHEIAVISHELRNSLSVIRNAARLLSNPSSSGIVDSARSLIERHAGQMSRHIGDLLEPQSRSASSQALNRCRVDLCTIARYAVDAIRPELVSRRHRLSVQLPETPVWVHADSARLEQVFSNLLINAAKYTPDGGDIGVLVEHDDASVYVRIRDSGVGIEPAMLSRVFGMYVQVAAAPPGRDNSHGIGLAVVRAVVEEHGGSVTAASAGLGSGSEFTIVLPSLRAQHDFMIIKL